jgi:hypothetical protein
VIKKGGWGMFDILRFTFFQMASRPPESFYMSNKPAATNHRIRSILYKIDAIASEKTKNKRQQTIERYEIIISILGSKMIIFSYISFFSCLLSFVYAV